MNLHFTNEYPASCLDEIVGYLLGPRLWIPRIQYPDFDEWLHKSFIELKNEQKRAMVALSGNDIAGVALYQRHKKDPRALEIKNLTVRPDMRGRYIASFLLRNVEIEGARDFNSSHIVCDAKADNLPIQTFLVRHRYEALKREDLYQKGAGHDIIYKKKLAYI